MKNNKPSITAAGIALLRAYESRKPENERMCYDPYAHYFVSPLMKWLMGFFMAIGYAEKRGPGVQGFLVARTRYIDDYLKSRLKDGLEQLVIIGAGYDSRAYRFEELKRLRTFEVDHPATQRIKIEKLKRVLGKLPENVTYVPVDFESETLKKRLYESGYNGRLKTLFIWEGVTMYLSAEAVDGTLAFIAQNSGKGSSVVFDYASRSIIDGTSKRGEVSSMRRSSRMTGERLIFGIEDGTIPEFIERRGFNHVINANSELLHKAYFTGVNQERAIAPVYSIVHAKVKDYENK